jgi:hypothetical protein
MIAMTVDGRELIVRINLDKANPRIEQLWELMQRAARVPGNQQMLRTTFAMLAEAVRQTILEQAPDMHEEMHALDAEFTPTLIWSRPS